MAVYMVERELKGITMDQLAADALSRDPARFEPLVSGAAGIGGIYDLWRRAKALVRGEQFQPQHGRKHS